MRLDSVLEPCRDGYVYADWPERLDSASDTDVMEFEDFLDV